jgi:hypothetical protein
MRRAEDSRSCPKPYAIAPTKAKSVVVHAQATDPLTGKAGDKLACVNVSFVDF